MADPLLGLLGRGPPRGPKRVTRTGLAVVHENELVYPAAGSAAEAVRAIGDANGSIQVYFPVQIEIREARSAPTPEVGPGARGAALNGDAIAQAIDPD